MTPLAEPAFAGGWASAVGFRSSNGVTQSGRISIPKRVLHVGLRSKPKSNVDAGRPGGSALGRAGRDRYGNRPVLIASQLLVASGPLFFLLATPSHHDWLLGLGCVGRLCRHQLCQPNLTLKLAGGNSPPYLATYFAATSVCYAASTVAGGYLFNLLGDLNRTCLGELTIYQAIFLFGWLSRTLGVVWLLAVDEPGLDLA